MAIKISSILNVWKGSSSKKSSSSSSNKSSKSSGNKSSSSTKSSGVKATSTKPVSKVSSSAKSTSVKSTSKSNTSTASTKTTSSTTYLKDASKLYNSSGVAYSYGRPAESYVTENKLKVKATSSKSTVAKKKEVKPQATQVPVAKKKTTTKKVYEPVDSRSAKGKYGNKNKAAEEGVSLAMSCVPIVGDGKDILEAVKGRDLITNKKLSGTERVITVAAAALPIIPAAPARKAVRKVATEPKVVKAVKNETKKLAKSSGDLVKKAKKALGVSGKKSAGVVEDVAKKMKSTVVSSGKKVGSQLEDVNKKAVQKGKDNARIEVENARKKIDSFVEVEISKSKYPESAQHIQDAIANGQPDILTIDRPIAKSNRKASLKGVSKIPGKDLDEYPPAMFKEGGKGASVRDISRSDNRGSGSSTGHQLRRYPNGTKVKYKITE